MSIKAIFSFEAIDSTRDLCDLFAYLFKKGIYYGGQLSINVASRCVNVAPFRLISNDGMHVISNSIETLEIKSNGSYYVVCKAKYNDDKDPTIELSLKTDSQVEIDAQKEFFVIFGKVNFTENEQVIIYDNRNIIKPIGE